MSQYDIKSYIQTYSGLEFYEINMIDIDHEHRIPFALELIEDMLNQCDNINILVDHTGTKMDVKFMTAIKNGGRSLRNKINENIAIGATGITYVLLRVYQTYTGKTFKVFKTRNEAMEYIKTLNKS